jgi:hypothetical protein
MSASTVIWPCIRRTSGLSPDEKPRHDRSFARLRRLPGRRLGALDWAGYLHRASVNKTGHVHIDGVRIFCPVHASRFMDRRPLGSLAAMGAKWPPCKMLVNELKKLPHYEGQLVLHAVAPDREIKITVQQGRYWVHCGVKKGNAEWTRLMAGRDSVEAARGTALWILREPI